jgi:hypothetical protein
MCVQASTWVRGARALTAIKLGWAPADAPLAMVGDRSRYGLCMSAVGAGVLVASVFIPWYDASFVARAEGVSVLAVHRLAALDAFHALPALSVVLLAVSALAMLDVLAPLVRPHGPVPGGAGGSVVLLGAVAVAVALYRMIDPPTLDGGAIALSLREGAWLAVIGSLTMMLGGMWPRPVTPEDPRRMQPETLSLN